MVRPAKYEDVCYAHTFIIAPKPNIKICAEKIKLCLASRLTDNLTSAENLLNAGILKELKKLNEKGIPYEKQSLFNLNKPLKGFSLATADEILVGVILKCFYLGEHERYLVLGIGTGVYNESLNHFLDVSVEFENTNSVMYSLMELFSKHSNGGLMFPPDCAEVVTPFMNQDTVYEEGVKQTVKPMNFYNAGATTAYGVHSHQGDVVVFAIDLSSI